MVPLNTLGKATAHLNVLAHFKPFRNVSAFLLEGIVLICVGDKLRL